MTVPILGLAAIQRRRFFPPKSLPSSQISVAVWIAWGGLVSDSLLAADPSGSKAVRIAGITCTGTTPGIAARVAFSFLPGPPGSSSASAGNKGRAVAVNHEGHTASFKLTTRREVPAAGREGRAAQLKHPLPGRSAATSRKGQADAAANLDGRAAHCALPHHWGRRCRRP
jgi:hypothetical protein